MQTADSVHDDADEDAAIGGDDDDENGIMVTNKRGV